MIVCVRVCVISIKYIYLLINVKSFEGLVYFIAIHKFLYFFLSLEKNNSNKQTINFNKIKINHFLNTNKSKKYFHAL